MADSVTATIPATDPDADERFFFRPLPGEPLRVGALGALFGLTLPLLSALVDQFFSKPIFCGHVGGSPQWCQAAPMIGYWTLMVLLSVGTTLLLSHWQIYRPLLISLAAALALWGLQKYISALTAHSLFEYTVYSTLVFAAAYLLFYWIMRLRQLIACSAAALVLVGLIRWLLIS